MCKELSTEQLRDKLLKVWNECEFGVKERVKRVHSARTVQYILKTPTYSNKEMIENIIDTIEAKVQEVAEEALEMKNSVDKIIAK